MGRIELKKDGDFGTLCDGIDLVIEVRILGRCVTK